MSDYEAEWENGICRFCALLNGAPLLGHRLRRLASLGGYPARYTKAGVSAARLIAAFAAATLRWREGLLLSDCFYFCCS